MLNNMKNWKKISTGIKAVGVIAYFVIASFPGMYWFAGVMAVAMCGAYGLDWMLKNDK